MKILVVTNIYPPHFIGGYELGCRDVVEGLRARGHKVRVLTGDFRNATLTTDPEPESEVDRTLRYRSQGGGNMRSHFAECRKFNATLNEFSPDLVYFWSQSGICRWLPLVARWRSRQAAFFLSDTSFVSWRVGAWLAGAARRNSLVRRLFGMTFLVQGWPVVRDQPCHFASEFLRKTAVEADTGFDAQKSMVAHWGIDPTLFSPAAPFRDRWPVHRLLFVGQVSRIKGIHTVIAALGELAKQGLNNLRLTVVGGEGPSDYGNELRALTLGLGLSEQIEFRGKIARSMLPQVYQEHDLLVLPSEWDEPFAIVPLEAMASGLAVVGTTTGGSGELLRNHETAFTFQSGDKADCARAIAEACRDDALFETVRARGQREVLQKHTLTGMVDILEAALRKLVD